MTPSESLVDLAERAAEDLRVELTGAPWLRSGRATLTHWRSILARQMAQDETGVDWAAARLTAIYSRSQLTPEQVDAAIRFNAAIRRIYTELPEEFAALLTVCDQIVATARKAA